MIQVGTILSVTNLDVRFLVYQGLIMKKKFNCPLEVTLHYLKNKWVILILRELFNGTKRFGSLYKGINGVSQKVLTQQLREMEKNGLVERKIFPEVPPKVEYSLTQKGNSIKPILEIMGEWGRKNGYQDIIDLPQHPNKANTADAKICAAD
jgi:DNA-binding HxlR family transcriptional regulator